MKKSIICLSVLIFIITGIIHAQTPKKAKLAESQTGFNLERTVHLKEDSKTEEVEIEIDKESSRFQLTIRSTIKSGSVTVEVYDASGKKQGNFSVGTQLSSEKSEHVDGNYSKSLTDPEPGAWRVKIIPTKASGFIRIQSSVSQ